MAETRTGHSAISGASRLQAIARRSGSRWRVSGRWSQPPCGREIALRSPDRSLTLTSTDFSPGAPSNPSSQVRLRTFNRGFRRMAAAPRSALSALARSLRFGVAAADGSGARQLTAGPGRFQGAPHWSPDGRGIAFDSEDNEGKWHIWTIDVEGGPPQQITKDPGNQNVPTWSRDGRSIYFVADRGMGADLWRIPAGGGTAVRVTRDGGLLGFESADGKSLVYQPRGGESPLLALSLTGGPTRQLVKCAKPTAFCVASQSLYYVECGSDPIRRFTSWIRSRVGIGCLAALRGFRPVITDGSLGFA
jgi:dipeptidyl aminopeptidase/acylaminoacyl peptidase